MHKNSPASNPPLNCWDLANSGRIAHDHYSQIPIGGFQKQSLVDYPGNIAAVMFTAGCNFRCIYCHNTGLVWPGKIKETSFVDTLNYIQWIEDNRNMLDAVVVTGGEPTLHKSLPGLLRKIKNIGLKVKLDTNGTNPEMLERVISGRLVDYVAMDIKTSLYSKNYSEITGVDISVELLGLIQESISLLKKGNVECEFRTTTIKNYHDGDVIKEIVNKVAGKIYLQDFVLSEGVKEKSLKAHGFLEKYKQLSNEEIKVVVR